MDSHSLNLVPSEVRRYRLTLHPLEGDGYTIETQEATTYLIHGSGFHIFVTNGRIVRAIAGHLIIEVREI